LERAEYGTLHEFSYYTKPLEETTAFVIFNQILEGLTNLHKESIVHLDLKETNLLIIKDNNNAVNRVSANIPFAVKISDFGISKVVSN
jgi:serine/threonine protein kinase